MIYIGNIVSKILFYILLLVGIVGLYEVLKLSGEEDIYINLAKTTSASVTGKLKGFNINANQSEIGDDDKIILVDVSHTNYLEKNCGYNLDNIIAIYDHHYESREFWADKLGEKARIETLGACATLIVEKAIELGVLEKLSKKSRILLAMAIISHTMNFSYEKIVTDRDKKVYERLQNGGLVSEDDIKEYFIDVSDSIIKNPKKELLNDFKPDIKLGKERLGITQAELREQKGFVNNNLDIILEILSQSESLYCFYMGASISTGETYFVTSHQETKDLVSRILGIQFYGDIGIFSKLIIRKEFIKLIMKS